MIPDPVLAWVFTVCFGATGVVSLVALVRSRTWTDRGSYFAHVLMSVSMAVMPWAWSMAIPALLQIVVFTAAALWYVGLAVLRPQTHAGPEGPGHHHRTGYRVYHGAMMAAMVWMSVLMTLMMGGGTSGDHMHDMGGMDRGGAGTAVMTGLWAQPVWAVIVTVAFVAMFVAAAVWFLVDLVRAPEGPTPTAPLSPIAQTLLNLVMAIGMAASFLVMG